MLSLILGGCEDANEPPGSSDKAGKYDVFTMDNGKLFLEGKPFAEISFNKYDLFWELWDQAIHGKELNDDNPMVAAQSKALQELHDQGFRTIRFFGRPYDVGLWRTVYDNPQKREELFYKTMDKTLDLCDRYGIKVVYDLGVGAFSDFKTANKSDVNAEHLRELVANPDSASRGRLYAYLNDVVQRYKDRKTIVMWELDNELTNSVDIGGKERIYQGERRPTLKQLADFYKDVAGKIKSIDPLRLVNNGGSRLRPSAWNANQGASGKTDTLDEHTQAYKMVFGDSPLDFIDIH
jgi:endo-1,4-beta-mannosidase